MTIKNNCSVCKWWMPFRGRDEVDTGECHKYPPSNDKPKWPITYGYEWCSKWMWIYLGQEDYFIFACPRCRRTFNDEAVFNTHECK